MHTDCILVGDSEIPLVGDWTFHSLGLVIAPACSLIAILVSFYLIFMHATHYTKPYEQRQYVALPKSNIFPLIFAASSESSL